MASIPSETIEAADPRERRLPADDPPASTAGAPTRGAEPRRTLPLGIEYRRAVAVVVALSVFALLWNLGGYRTLNTHEGFAAVPAREMLLSGDWIVPRFGGVERSQKPPLGYWMIAASNWLCGGATAWSVRFPSAVAALLLAALVALWGTRWYGRCGGLAAGLMQATCVGSLLYGRSALVDITLCLLMTACLYLIATQPEHEPHNFSRRRWFAIYVLLSLSWLAKFFFATAFVAAPVLVFWLIERRPDRIKAWKHLPGILMLAVATTAWPLLLYLEAPQALRVLWSDIAVKGSSESADLGREWWFYVPHLLALCAPWTLFFLAAVPESWRRAWKHGDRRERFLWVWGLTQVLALTMISSRHGNYILPAVPMVALVTGRWLAAMLRRLDSGKLVLTQGHAIRAAGVMVFFLGLATWLIDRRYPEQRMIVQGTAAAAVVLGTAALWCASARRYCTAFLVIVVASTGAYLSATTWIVPQLDHRLAATEFAGEVRRELPPQARVDVFQVDAVENGMDPVVFYLRAPVQRVASMDDLRARLRDDGELYVVTYNTRLDDLRPLGITRCLHEMKVPPGAPPARHPPLVLVRVTSPWLAGSENHRETR